MPTSPKKTEASLRSNLKDGKKLPHLSELAENFVRVVGGPSKLAEMLFEEWIAAGEGSLVRQRILDIITRVWKFASESDEKPDDTGLMTDEDLDREIDGVVNQIKEKSDGRSRTKERSDAAGKVSDELAAVVEDIGSELTREFSRRDTNPPISENPD
jgi:hypothetical protein